MKIHLSIICFIASLLLFSCASIVNGPSTRIQINADTPLKVAILNDTTEIIQL